MAGEKFPGSIIGTVVEVRFAFSGIVRSVGKRAGDMVRQGELIASLDTSVFQKELDVQLADYEQERADFEIFNLKNKGGDDITRYQKTSAQSRLNSSVKSVELAKGRLDQVNLISPVSGLVVDVGALVPGLNVTPSGHPVQVLDSSGFTFRFAVDQGQLSVFRQPHRARVHLPHLGRELEGVTTLPLPGSATKQPFVVLVRLGKDPELLPDMEGEVELVE
jgi:multidrug efflux pump subunit AcrA (membrane-fusion protein)